MPNPSPTPRQHFNSRPSARGDRACRFLVFCGFPFQFTPLREGRRMATSKGAVLYLISIHAPPRGATSGCPRACASFGISIHAPPRGATQRQGKGQQGRKNFNSRPSARGDSKRYAISANLLFNPYKSAWLNNNATQFVEIILVIFHRIIA